MLWVLKTGDDFFWDKDSHSWAKGLDNATVYKEEERAANKYPRLTSPHGLITWEGLHSEPET